MILQISYDLKGSFNSYAPFYAAIQSLGESSHVMTTVWWLKTDISIKEVSKLLQKHLGESDLLLITDITGKVSDGWLGQSRWKWYKENNHLI